MEATSPISELVGCVRSDEDRAALREWTRSWSHHPRPVLFAGAGLSTYHSVPHADAPASARMKSWSQLAADFRDILMLAPDQAPGDPLRLAELVARHTSRTRLLDVVRAAVPDAWFDPGAAHRAIAAIPWAAVVTTNYDTLLERAYEHPRVRPLVVVSDTDLAGSREPEQLLLIKMHGDLSRAETIVISEDDYRSYENGAFARPGIALKVRQLLMEHPVLFLGYGLADPNVERLLGWVRDTVGRLQVPAIAVVHSPPRRAERAMWAERGIQLIECGAPKEDLVSLLEAVQAERRRPFMTLSDAASHARVRIDQDAILAAVGARRADEVATRAVSSFVAAAETHASEGPVADAMRAAVRQLVTAVSAFAEPGGDWSPLLLALPQPLLTRLAQVLARSGFHLRVRPGVSVDLRVGLVVFSDTPLAAKVRYFVAWLDERVDEATVRELDAYGSILKGWERPTIDPEARAELSRARLDVASLRMDEHQLAQDARRHLVLSEEFARAGSMLLMLGNTEEAAERFREARDSARNEDERYAALLGLAATDDPSAAEATSRIAPELLRVRAELEKIRERAAQRSLAGDAEQAADDLVRYCREARRQGWPASSGRVSAAAKRATAMMLAETDTDPERVARALGVRVQFGVGDGLRNDVSFTAIERAGRSQPTRERIRELVLRPGLPSVPRRAQRGCAALVSDLLTDDELSVLATALAAETESDAPSRPSRWYQDLADSWEAFKRAGQRFPSGALRTIARVLPRLWPRRSLFDHSGAFSTHLAVLPELRGAVEIDELSKWISATLSSDQLTDWVLRRPFLELISEMHQIVSADTLATWCDALEARIAPHLHDGGQEHDSDVLDTLALFASMEREPRNLEVSARYLAAMGDRIGNSSSVAEWASTVQQLARADGPALPELRAAIGRAAGIGLPYGGRGEPLGRAFRSDAVPRALVDVIGVSKGTISSDELALLERYAALNPSALSAFARPAIGVSAARCANAERQLAQAAMMLADRTEAIRGLADWCVHRAPGAETAEVLVSLAAVGGSGDRRVLAGSVERMRAGGLVPDALWARIGARLLDATGESYPWVVRAEAVLGVGVLHDVLGEAGAKRIAALTEDDITIVRRAAQSVARRGPMGPVRSRGAATKARKRVTRSARTGR